MRINPIRISNVSTKNNFYNIQPSKDKPRNEITQRDEETFSPPSGKGWCELVQVADFFTNATCEIKKLFHKRWLNDLVKDKSGVIYEECINILKKCGYRKDEAKIEIDYCISNVKRVKETAKVLSSWGKIASFACNITIVLGIVKNLISENTSELLKKTLDFAYGISRSVRSYYQGSMYNKDDDDASKNRFEADVYDNKIAGFMANAATFTETKINPWALALNELLDEKYKNPAKRLLTSITPLWFRARMPAHIRQSFFTDFFKFLIYKIPSLFGHKKSIEIINEVNKRGNLNFSYIWKRICILAGLTETKGQKPTKYFNQLFKLTKGIFGSDLERQKDSAKKLNESIAAPLGFYGFFAMGVSMIAGPILKLFGLETKLFDFLYSSSITSQQLIYFPRLVVPVINDKKQLEKDLANPEYIKDFKKEGLEGLKNLCKKQKKLYYIGVTCLLLNVLSTSLKLKAIENPIFQKVQNIIDELSGSLIQKFFSERRHVIGHGFKVQNPEFYEDEETINGSNTSRDSDEKPELRVMDIDGLVKNI